MSARTSGGVDMWIFGSGNGVNLVFLLLRGKLDRTNGWIFSSKGLAMTTISGGGARFLIHGSFPFTTHVNLPSTAALRPGSTTAVSPLGSCHRVLHDIGSGNLNSTCACHKVYNFSKDDEDLLQHAKL